MKSTTNMRKVEDNNFVAKWWSQEELKIYTQRKRQKDDVSDLHRKICLEYSLKGIVAAIKLYRQETGTSLKEAYAEVNKMRGDERL